jgi:hypothetical protein
VELDGAGRSEVRFQQCPVGFQDGDGSAPIVIGALRVEVSGVRAWRFMQRRLPGAGRNGHILVLIGRVSVNDIWETHKVVPVLMGRSGNNLIWGSGSVDAGDPRVNLVETIGGQAVIASGTTWSARGDSPTPIGGGFCP